jgi:hypothetical protein
LPLHGQFVRFRQGTHGFTIQFATSCVNRAATAVFDPLYWRATTQASTSRVPSEFRNRSLSANSNGNVEAKSTSRDVPNSMTVLSLRRPLFPSTRVKETAIRSGVEFGKNFASLAVELSREERPRAVASLGKWVLDFSAMTLRLDRHLLVSKACNPERYKERECTSAAKDWDRRWPLRC